MPLIVSLFATLLAGCCPYGLCVPQNRDVPQIVFGQKVPLWTGHSPRAQIRPPSADHLSLAKWHLAEATAQEGRGLEGCNEQYYQSAIHSWQHLATDPELSIPSTQSVAAWQIYQESLARLLTLADRNGQLDERGKLIIGAGDEQRIVRITHHGFAWKPHEFTQLRPAEEFQHHSIARHYQTRGLGTPLVAVRQSLGEEPFRTSRQHFPVTAILRPRDFLPRDRDRAKIDSSHDDGAVLEFYNPRVFDSVAVGSTIVGLSRDLTAPFANLLRDTPRRFTEGLLDPDDAEVQPRLFMHEPYQPGKIPVVFIHGLWSDPVTWVDMANDLSVEEDLYRNYQLWFFRYPTGRGLLESSAELRESLLVARDFLDPAHEDLALEKMVLVGHSMGGIVAKLQISDSRDILWRRAASQELETVRTTPEMRERLRRMFFFEASPLVRGIISIGTPHRGSEYTRRVAGRIASRLVRISEAEEARYRQLMDNNRDIFAEFLWDSWPTSIDLLEPTNPMLQAIGQLPPNPRVARHTIIGDAALSIRGEPTDGVVSVASARQFDVESELTLPIRHSQLHHSLAASQHVRHILRAHAQQIKREEVREMITAPNAKAESVFLPSH